MRQYSSSKKSEIIRKYLDRRESRTEFSRRYNVPVKNLLTSQTISPGILNKLLEITPVYDLLLSRGARPEYYIGSL